MPRQGGHIPYIWEDEAAKARETRMKGAESLPTRPYTGSLLSIKRTPLKRYDLEQYEHLLKVKGHIALGRMDEGLKFDIGEILAKDRTLHNQYLIREKNEWTEELIDAKKDTRWQGKDRVKKAEENLAQIEEELALLQVEGKKDKEGKKKGSEEQSFFGERKG